MTYQRSGRINTITAANVQDRALPNIPTVSKLLWNSAAVVAIIALLASALDSTESSTCESHSVAILCECARGSNREIIILEKAYRSRQKGFAEMPADDRGHIRYRWNDFSPSQLSPGITYLFSIALMNRAFACADYPKIPNSDSTCS